MGEIIVGDGDTVVIKAGTASVTVPLVVVTERPKPEPKTIWDRDISSELATNDNCPGSLKDGWWQRRLDRSGGPGLSHRCASALPAG